MFNILSLETKHSNSFKILKKNYTGYYKKKRLLNAISFY